MNKHSSQKGFTLIEVLIAAIILFSSIALVAELFSSSSLSSQKASQVTQYNQTLPLVKNIIKDNIQLQAKDRSISQMNGTVLAFGVSFIWNAQRVSLLPAAPEEESDSPGENKFGLFSVTIATEKEHSSIYTFEVATW